MGKKIGIVENFAEIRHRIGEMVARFQREKMGLQAKSVDVDIHEAHILVTLNRVVSVAERESARDREAREQLERLASAAYEAISEELETKVALLAGRPVIASRISIDPNAGDAVLKFLLKEAEPPAG